MKPQAASSTGVERRVKRECTVFLPYLGCFFDRLHQYYDITLFKYDTLVSIFLYKSIEAVSVKMW